ncbi:hypothetical protein B0H12DRAFT_1105283 [Mycena haematopus]|nr:hypothetical protein B0H12DRAFT_1168675 [Mycena haematopus]KAJ7227984.1 hypothetical protein B0H12DRAFT_1148228 [Mycena haematopus]KAJ7261697.1 hypothetical protein B0H12DRAFT_1105283 [Mycena haematopus]
MQRKYSGLCAPCGCGIGSYRPPRQSHPVENHPLHHGNPRRTESSVGCSGFLAESRLGAV